MLVTLVRTIVLYIIILIVMRLMGKREIGQLQPFELVVAILIADLAAVPMADTRNPNTKWNNTNTGSFSYGFNNLNNEHEKYKSKRNVVWKTNDINL